MSEALQIPWSHVATVATTLGGYLLAFILIPRILLGRREAGATLAWILAIVFLPYLGAALFFLIGRTRVQRRTRRRIRYHDLLVRSLGQLPCSPARSDASARIQDLPEPTREISRVATCLTGTPLLPGNRVEVLIDTNKVYRQMEEAILSAEQNIHMMSYIFRADQAGTRFRNALIQKAKEGVEVRLLVDGVGSHSLGSRFVRPLLEAGARFARFMPVFRFSPHWRPNLRNHRKILVCDSRIGFTGGLNIGEEYRGRKKKFGPWRDTHVRLEGPAVLRLQETFAEDWFFATDEDLIDPKYFPATEPVGTELVHVVDSGPDHVQENIHTLFFTAISRAEKKIYITTPYFVPGPAMLEAIKASAWRGVDVRLLLPGKSDLKLVQVAGRSYYRELLEAGVRLYEHRPGILHAKTMVVDGVWSTVGSANMDIRSFRLNFEVNVLVSGEEVARQMEEIFLSDISSAREMTMETQHQKPKITRLAEAVGRILSPVL